jgi:cytochrome c
VFRQCAGCHNLREGAEDRYGPNLWGVLGKRVASASTRFPYTAALRDFGGTWTCGRLDLWLKSPAQLVPGTRMAFAGLPDGIDRADVIAYIAQQDGSAVGRDCPAVIQPR